MTRSKKQIQDDIEYEIAYADLYCDSCGWACEFTESHIEHSMLGYGLGLETRCKYMDAKYEIWISCDGDLLWKERSPSSIIAHHKLIQIIQNNTNNT
jgi:hypothetical protein